MGILQARTLESVAMPSSSGLNLCLLCLLHWQADFLSLGFITWEAQSWLYICYMSRWHHSPNFSNYFLHIHAEIFSHLLPYTCLMLRPSCLSFLLLACWHLSFSVLLFWQMFLVVFLAQVTNEYPVLLLLLFGPCFHQLKTKILIERILIVLFFFWFDIFKCQY